MMVDPYVRYDYAWKTPAWTVQNPSFPMPAADGYLDPGLPSDVSLVRVYGKFMEMDSGRPLEGVLRVRTSKTLYHAPSGTQLPPGQLFRLRFTRNNQLSVYLPATDDPQLTSDGPWTYEGSLTVRGVTQKFEFSLPADPSEVNIVSLIPTGDEGILVT